MAAGKQTIVPPQSNRVRLVVASSVMLTFISFWRAAAIVLNDLGSSAFYAGGLAEEAVGKAAQTHRIAAARGRLQGFGRPSGRHCLNGGTSTFDRMSGAGQRCDIGAIKGRENLGDSDPSG